MLPFPPLFLPLPTRCPAGTQTCASLHLVQYFILHTVQKCLGLSPLHLAQRLDFNVLSSQIGWVRTSSLRAVAQTRSKLRKLNCRRARPEPCCRRKQVGHSRPALVWCGQIRRPQASTAQVFRPWPVHLQFAEHPLGPLIMTPSLYQTSCWLIESVLTLYTRKLKNLIELRFVFCYHILTWKLNILVIHHFFSKVRRVES